MLVLRFRGRAAGGAAVAVTARTVPAAVSALALLAAVPALSTWARGGQDFSLALQAAAVVSGAGAGFAAEDQAANVLAPSPTPLVARRALRAAAVLLVLGVGFATALAAAGAAPGQAPGLAGPLAVLAATAGLSAAAATAGGVDGPLAPGPPAAAASVLAILTLSALSVRWPWLPCACRPSFDASWLWVAAGGSSVALARSRDPARRRGAWR